MAEVSAFPFEKEVEKRMQKFPKEEQVVQGCERGQQRLFNPAVLSPVELEVLHLLTDEFLTPEQVAVRRKCSQQAVSKIILKLRKKGALKFSFDKVVKTTPTKQPHGTTIRLHGQQFRVEIIWSDDRYKQKLAKCNVLMVDGTTIKLWRDCVEVYSGMDFWGEDAQMATARSFEHWQKFFARLENDLKIILVKPRAQNVKLVNAHYAEVHNELARDCNIKAERIKIHTTDDGKLWFLIDNSFNLHEAENVHPQTAQRDNERVVGFFNDLRDYPVPVLSELVKVVHRTEQSVQSVVGCMHVLAKQQEVTNQQLQCLIQALTPQRSVSQDVDEGAWYFG